jgi:UDP-N-acetylenolpyruvoylglucosamine reductase
LEDKIYVLHLLSRQIDQFEIRPDVDEIADEVIAREPHMSLTVAVCLNLIPGTCGEAMIQNSGQEVSRALHAVEVFDANFWETPWRWKQLLVA